MKKRLFQIFDEMNVNDEKNKTALLPCAFTMVEAKTAKGGGHVTMGVEAYIIQKIFLGEMQPVLVLMDKKEYYRLEAIPASDELQAALARTERAEKALRQVRDWQLPSTGKYWDHGTNHEPMSYEACYGSNGVRDYFRNLANQTLNDNKEPEALTPKQGSNE